MLLCRVLSCGEDLSNWSPVQAGISWMLTENPFVVNVEEMQHCRVRNNRRFAWVPS